MFRFFDYFSKGCGCTLGAVAGIVIALVIIALLFGTCETVVGL